MRRALILPLLLGLAAPVTAPAAELALERVLLTTGGVGYLGYRGTVGEDHVLRLRVPLRQVDDILKSLTVIAGDGEVGAVSLLGPTPLADAFRDAPFGERDLADLPSLLLRLRGSELELRGPATLRGRLLSVAREEVVENEARLVRHRLSLTTDDGIRSAILENADAVVLVSQGLREQVRLVLGRLADSLLDQQRELQIELDHAAGQEVGVGYLAEMPVWKASYRLVADETQGLLQGWAIFENVSGQDWRDVQVTLVAGSPTALRQPLFQSRFVPRPEVDALSPAAGLPRAAGDLLAEMAPDRRDRSFKLAAPAPVAAAPAAMAPAALATAPAQELTAQTLYPLPRKVSLPAGRSIMAPLVDVGLPIERVVLYRADQADGRPEAALRVRNSGDTSLPAGLATLYQRLPDGGLSFLGDARLPQMAPAAEELVGYGLDPNVEVVRREGAVTRLERARIGDGVLELARVEQQRSQYAVKARFQGAARQLVLEQPLPPDWRLAEPKDAKVDGGTIRVERSLAAASTLDLALVVEHPLMERIVLADADLDQLQLLAAEGELPPEIQATIARLQELSARLGEIEQRLAAVQSARDAGAADQERLRANLAAVPPNSDLARRYLGQLGTSEDGIAARDGELLDLRAQRERASQERRDYLRSLRS